MSKAEKFYPLKYSQFGVTGWMGLVGRCMESGEVSRSLILRKCYFCVPEQPTDLSIVLKEVHFSQHQRSLHSTFLLNSTVRNHLSSYIVNSVTSYCLAEDKNKLSLCLEESNHF